MKFSFLRKLSSPKFVRRYGGAGSRTLLQLDATEDKKSTKSDDDSSDDVVLNIGWRRGQPPRSDVVVKLSSESTAARATNKILVNCKKWPNCQNLSKIFT